MQNDCSTKPAPPPTAPAAAPVEDIANDAIRLTRPLLPDLADYAERLAPIWQQAWLTNHGPAVQALESALRDQLGVPRLAALGNGTSALMVALAALGLKGEVITTPFTFPGTVHALSWLGLEPVFCDIDPVTLTLAPECVEQAIGPRTSAILGVHLFSNSCDVEALATIARRHQLKLVFDAAHAFGTRINEVGIGCCGDVSMFSLHATKLFHTAEGGLLAASDPELQQRIEDLRNFGIRNEFEVVAPGINAKMNELQATLGLAILPLIAAEQAKRQALRHTYIERLAPLPGVSVLTPRPDTSNNQQFMAIRIAQDSPLGSAHQVLERLRRRQIHARRYFHPLISDYAHYRHLESADPKRLPVAQRATHEVLCLPFYSGLSDADLGLICDTIADPSEWPTAPLAHRSSHA